MNQPKLITLRCRKCLREMQVDRQPIDYPEAVRLELTCYRCDKGDFDESVYFDAQGKHIIRDPSEGE